MQQVGVIGLGKMGVPIARNLMERGFAVIGYRRSGSAELAKAGGSTAGSAAGVAEQADVLLSIVPDTAAVADVVCGDTGTLAGLRPGTVHIEMSTVDVARKSAIRDAVQRRGGDMLDCPISGSPAMVGPRLATTFVSGEQASVQKVRAVLDAMSGPWVYTGAFGTGARLKYIANLLLAVRTVAAAEAMELARRSGLDLDLVQRTLDDSIGSSASWRQRGPLMRDRAWSPAPGPITTLHPILQQIEDCAGGHARNLVVDGCDVEVAPPVRQRLVEDRLGGRENRRGQAGLRASPVRLGGRAGRGDRHRRPRHRPGGRTRARAGYCVANDITARGHHRRDAMPADACRYDWFAAKSMDGALPLGPGITPAFQVPDPQHLRLRLWVNGELQQDESTADMVCTVAELIAAASEVATLEAGDVIATGNPSGVGAGRGLYLRPGNIVRTSIDGLGTLENTVVNPSGGAS